MKKLTIFLVFSISISVFSVLSCSNNDEEIFRIVNALIGPEGGKITSSDGRLTLDIPAGALDEDTEITITKINPNDLPPEFEGIDADLAYLLEPDGLEFNIPIEVELLTDQEALDQDGNISVNSILLFTSLNGELELLGNIENIINADDNTVLVKGSLEHFTDLVQTTFSITTRIENVPETIGINIPFTIDVIVMDTFNPIFVTLLTDAFLVDAFYTDMSVEDIISTAPLDLVLQVIPNIVSVPLTTILKTSFDYICDSSEATNGIFGAQTDLFAIVESQDADGTTFFIDVRYKQNFAKFIDCPVVQPTPAPNVTCAVVSQIDFDAIIESIFGQTSQAPFIIPNACAMSKVTITNNNMGGTVIDDVPDGSGGGFSTLVNESGIPFFSPAAPAGPEGQVCGFSAFGRDDIAGGNDVGILVTGEFTITTEGFISSDDIKFEVSYGVDTAPENWVGGPFTVNCGVDPQGELTFTLIIPPPF